MPTSTTSTSSNKLSRCKKAFDLWRKEQAIKSTKPIIPDSLWKEAIALIPEFSISRIASELRLNQARLRLKQLELSSSLTRKQKAKQSIGFFELQHPITIPTQSTSNSDLHFSIQKTDGSRLTLSFPTEDFKLAETLFISFLQA